MEKQINNLIDNLLPWQDIEYYWEKYKISKNDTNYLEVNDDHVIDKTDLFEYIYKKYVDYNEDWKLFLSYNF